MKTTHPVLLVIGMLALVTTALRAEQPKEAATASKTPIKDVYVANMRAAAERILNSAGNDVEKYGKHPSPELKAQIDKKSELCELVANQADYSEQNNGFAFFEDNLNSKFEKGLSERGLGAAKKVANHLIGTLLPQIRNFPLDAKVASDFTTITSASLIGALEARAKTLGLEH